MIFMTPERQTEIHNVRTCDFPQTLEEQKNLQRLVDNGVFTVTYGLISQGKVDDDVRVSLGDNFSQEIITERGHSTVVRVDLEKGVLVDGIPAAGLDLAELIYERIADKRSS